MGQEGYNLGTKNPRAALTAGGMDTEGGTSMPRGVYPRNPLFKTLPSERFWAKVDQNGPVPTGREHLGPCWLWTGTVVRAGYGTFRMGSRLDGSRKNVRAHRFIFDLVGKSIPEDLVIDHLCRNRRCVNPDHLEPVSTAVNIKRGNAGRPKIDVHGSRRWECPNGHPANEANTYTRSNGYRYCRVCARQR